MSWNNSLTFTGKMSINTFGLCLLFLCVSFCNVGCDNVRSANPWDLLIFTQQWPATVCREWKDHGPSHKCSLPHKQDSWTIHGIWPTKLGTIGPAFCNRSWHFDPEVIKPIEPKMLELWTNIEADTSEYSLWTHEWSKHGTCAAVLEPLNSELKYFSKGLEWLENFSMSTILEEANIVPSNDKEYPIIDIHNAVQNKLGINPAIECRKEDGKSWLVEIRVCFNKTLSLVNCDGILSAKKVVIGDEVMSLLTNCNPADNILYPHKQAESDPPKRLYVHLYRFVSWLQWLTL